MTYRWYLKTDTRWKPYDDQDNKNIEDAYQQSLIDETKKAYNIQLSHNNWFYNFDFSEEVWYQINPKTNMGREIKRK